MIVDLFAGPGGWDEGVRLAGYTGPLVGIEWDRDACRTAVQGDPRIGRPGHKDRSGGERQFEQGSVRVTVQEAAILQGFHPDYPWQGSKSSRHQQIGNAVPPPLAAAILHPLIGAEAEAVAA